MSERAHGGGTKRGPGLPPRGRSCLPGQLPWGFVCAVFLLAGNVAVPGIENEGLHHSSHPKSHSPPAKPLPKVLVCAQVRDQLSDVVEWAEFYYLQGVSKIVVYDQLSSDKLRGLNALYQRHNRSYLEVVDAGPEGDGETLMERIGTVKVANYHRCHKDNPEAEWLLFVDVDEYIWSPKYKTLQQFLGSQDVPDDLNQIRVHQMRFGTGGVKNMSKYEIRMEDGQVTLTNPDERNLLIDMNVMRGPDERVGEPADALRWHFQKCATADVMSECDHCHQNCAHKSIVRANALVQSNIHDSRISHGQDRFFDLNLVRGHHYMFQSRAYVVLKYTSGSYDSANPDGYLDVDEFYSSIQDVSLKKAYSHLIRNRLDPLFIPSLVI